MDKNEYKKAVEKLNLWAKAYYIDDAPLATDAEYDALYSEVVEFESKNESEILPYSITRRVGIVSDKFDKSTHEARMWSMEDIFSFDELKAWIKRAEKRASEGGVSDITSEFYCEPKFDGASLNILYENGVLVKAATRGDGVVGEDITPNAKVINSIPLQISYLGRVEIRGEVVIAKDDFEKLNESRLKSSETPFANPRNAAAGSLRQLDSSVTAKRRLKFIPWDIGYCDKEFETHLEVMEFIRGLGFLQDSFVRVCKDADEIEKAYNELLKKRDKKEILMDGMVVRINELKTSQILGYTVKNPRFMVAYKFPAIEKVTKLNGIGLQVGRSGVITPVARLEAVNIDGAVVRNATLHNFDEIKRLDLHIGDFVSVVRSGDVIPKITGVFKDRREDGALEIVPPTHCPECGSKLLVEDILIKCQNLDCKARAINSLIYFASKKCMDIDGLGVKVVEQLFENSKISKIIDIYNLKEDDLKDLDGFKDRKISNLLSAIENSKNAPLERFITSLGIEHVGEVAARDIAKSFKGGWLDASFDEILKLDGFGEIIARSFVDFIAVNRAEILALLEVIKPKIPSFEESKKSAFSGKSVVITGTLSRPRDEFRDELLSMGAKVSNSVSQKTDFVLAGESAGSKLEKALTLGVKVIDEDEYRKLCES